MPDEAAPRPQPKAPSIILRAVIRVILAYGLAALLLFLSAGTLDYHGAWLFLVVVTLTFAVNLPLVLRKNPSIIRERMKSIRPTKTFDKFFFALYIPSAVAIPIVAGFDARFAWSSLPAAWPWIGIVLYAAGDVPMVAALCVNPYLVPTVKIQTELGHRVITTGPYRVVRHPMYAGALFVFVAVPLILGSLWAFVPVGLDIALFIFRTAMEDRTLQKELPGYAEYAQRTRYRLVPHVW